MATVGEIDSVTQVQILDEADWILRSTNTFGKGMNPITSLPQLWVNRSADWALALIRQPVKGRKILNSNNLTSAKIDLVSHSACVNGLVNNSLQNWPCVTSDFCGRVCKHIDGIQTGTTTFGLSGLEFVLVSFGFMAFKPSYGI